MFDEIIIGTGKYGNSWIVYPENRELQQFISENKSSYRCDDELTTKELIIMKDTSEGEQLDRMIQEKVDVQEVKNYLTELTLKHLKATDLRNVINRVKEDSFKKGIEHNQEQMRKALGL